MIQNVKFQNFKAYRSLDLDLEPFTVLVGPNASGKTTLLDGLRFATEVLDGQRRISSVPSRIRSYGVDGDVLFSLSGIWAGKSGHLGLDVVSRSGKDPAQEQSLAVEGAGEWGGNTFELTDGVVTTKSPHAGGEAFNSVQLLLKATTVLRFEPRRLMEASYSEASVPGVASDGTGLASVLAYLKLERDEIFNEVELALKQVVPTVRRIRIERASVEQTAIRTISLDNQSHQVPETRRVWGHRIVLDMRGAKGVSADTVGEGTILVLGLLSVLMGPVKPRLVLLDDIELGLHPAAQGKLVQVLRKLQERDPELQIIATSHSPFVLNYLEPKEVRMTSLAENGFARCVKMTAHPEFERWKDLMSPGEFWSSIGESWVEKTPETKSHE